VIDAPSLSRSVADDRPFAEHISKKKGRPEAVVFDNLKRDATLIAPASAGSNPNEYAHCGAFFQGRGVPPEQRDAMWRNLGNVISGQLNRGTLWVSTDGRGVSWLHFRVEGNPKYYKTNRYTTYRPNPVGGGKRPSQARSPSPDPGQRGNGPLTGSFSAQARYLATDEPTEPRGGAGAAQRQSGSLAKPPPPPPQGAAGTRKNSPPEGGGVKRKNSPPPGGSLRVINITFQPGPHGILGDPESGLISRCKGGPGCQATANGIQSGWRIVKLDGAKFDNQLWLSLCNGMEAYQITFDTGGVEPAPNPNTKGGPSRNSGGPNDDGSYRKNKQNGKPGDRAESNSSCCTIG